LHIPHFEEAPGRVRIVTGYKAAAIRPAMKGRRQCRAVSASFRPRAVISWQKKGFIRIPAQTGRKRNQNSPEVPTISNS
jgi:hypothetical protein